MDKESVFVNQLGYLPQSQKLAYASHSLAEKRFFIVSATGAVVWEGRSSCAVEDRAAGEKICRLDFSSFTSEGEFYLSAGSAKSFLFRIGNGIFDGLYHSLLNYFTLSRCGQAVKNPARGGSVLWNHPACHTGPADIYGTDLKKEVDGGWHDAGDYGRYAVAGTKAVMDLLLAQKKGAHFDGFDILDEVRFELEWLLKMQREDGAVYHKVSTYKFGGFVFPQTERAPLVLAPVSTAATADFAGCLAYSSAFFKERDADFADHILDAAKKAQEFIDGHKDLLYENPPEISTGSYGDREVRDEKYFALCSLFAATGRSDYLEEAEKIWEDVLKNPCVNWQGNKIRNFESFGWASVAGYGSEILLDNADKIKDKELVAQIRAAILERAQRLLSVSKAAAFGTCLERFFWGSNGHICDEAHLLLLAYELTGNQEYKSTALRQLDYVLGCNPLNLCYVTGAGTLSPKKPHHRPSGAAGSVMPGMLSGGPGEGLHDDVAKKKLAGRPPLQCFIDDEGSYSTNEVAIYWNSPLVYLLSRLMYNQEHGRTDCSAGN